MITVCVLVLGLPHLLVVWTFFKPGELDPWYYFHFVWTLVYWLALLGLPATFVASHRLSLVSAKDIGCSDG